MFKKHFPIICISLLVGIIALTNLSWHQWLIGWDNLISELNFPLNIFRSVFAVWQEQGVGFLGGNGHAADLPRQLLLFLLSPVIPQQLLRQVYTICMLLTGSIGAYVFIRFFLRHIREHIQEKQLQLFAFAGGLFYLLNLATIQMFYVPFEPFIAHFAFLPWLFFGVSTYLTDKSKRSFLRLIGILLISLFQGQLPTIFLVSIMALVIFAGTLAVVEKSTTIIKKTGKFLVLLILINAFWLFPFAYFTITQSHVAVDAKINQVSTDTVLEQNKEFGHISDAMLLRGFWFNNVDPNREGQFTYMFLPWKKHFSSPLIKMLGYGLFGIIFFGLIRIRKQKQPFLIGAAVLFVFSFTMLALASPPFSWINDVFHLIPIIHEVFRFPFTKFSVLAAFIYAIFLSFGLSELSLLIREWLATHGPHGKGYQILRFLSPQQLVIIVSIMLCLLSFPAFTGHLIYDKEHVTIPKDYTELFQFFKTQDPQARVANFPQYTFWGWSFYTWGYGGSGFLWYGMSQPILDRAFDVWSPGNENYYWEVTHALYGKNPEQLQAVLQKYQVRYILVDKNITTPYVSKMLFVDELEAMTRQIPGITKVKSFGKIDVYTLKDQNAMQGYVFAKHALPTVNQYAWSDYDSAYLHTGDYVSVKETTPSSFYPFHALFSAKDQRDMPVHITDTKNTIALQTNLPIMTQPSTLTIPSLGSLEDFITAQIIARRDTDDSVLISAIFKTPQVILSENGSSRVIWGGNVTQDLFRIPKDTTYPLELNSNGTTTFIVRNPGNKQIVLGSVSFAPTQNNLLVLSDLRTGTSQTSVIDAHILQSLFTTTANTVSLPPITTAATLQISIPKVENGDNSYAQNVTKEPSLVFENCDHFRVGTVSKTTVTNDDKQFLELSATHASACASFYLPNLTYKEGYVIFADYQNLEGRGLHFWILNENAKYTPIDTYLPGNKAAGIQTFVLPPMESYGRSYSVHFDTISLDDETSKNRIGAITLYPIPYNFLSDLMIQTANQPRPQTVPVSATYKNPSLSIVTDTQNLRPGDMLLFSQAFNSGWRAYAVTGTDHQFIKQLFPFIFGKAFSHHVLVNNWENGWQVDTLAPDTQIMIVYLPQYFAYLGDLIFFGTLMSIGASCILFRKEKRA